MPAKFELKKAKNKKVYFNLLAANGEIILTSQMYAGKGSAKKGIRSVQANCSDDDRFVVRKGKGGKEHFVLRAANNRVIGNSQTYKSSSALKNGIKSVKKSGKTAKIIDFSGVHEI